MNNDNANSEAKEEWKVQVEDWIQPKEHERRHKDGNPHGNNVGRKTQDNNEEEKNGNRHNELYEEDSDNEEEEVCRLRNDDDKVKEKSNETDILTEKEHEQEHFNLLIDECACNDSCNVCLHSLTNEEDNILQEAAKEEVKRWKEKFHAEKVMKVKRQIEECLCRNVCDVCYDDLSREEIIFFGKPLSKHGNPKLEKSKSKLEKSKRI